MAVAGVLTALVVLPASALWLVVALLLVHVAGGGTFGGYGAAAESPDVWWAAPVSVLLLVAALVFASATCAAVPYWVHCRAARGSSSPEAATARQLRLRLAAALVVLSGGVMALTTAILWRAV